MDKTEFINKREFLYHLTDRRNLEIILTNGTLLSTNSIIELTEWDNPRKTNFKRSRRPNHEVITIIENNYYIRDQRPISQKNLAKCLTGGLNVADYIELLNNRVFFWPTIQRLQKHYNRYVAENPLIIRVSSQELLDLNRNAEFCRLNSGATRSSSYYDGAPPPRGEETFLLAEEYENNVGSVAEVTFPNSCQLPEVFHIGDSPQGRWRATSLT